MVRQGRLSRHDDDPSLWTDRLIQITQTKERTQSSSMFDPYFPTQKEQLCGEIEIGLGRGRKQARPRRREAEADSFSEPWLGTFVERSSNMSIRS